jgi:hypothetical protein
VKINRSSEGEHSRRREAERDEHEQWQMLCQELKKSGAVTEEDLKSSVTLLSTSGQYLLSMIRAWGDYRARLGER